MIVQLQQLHYPKSAGTTYRRERCVEISGDGTGEWRYVVPALRLALEKEQLCTVMFLAIILFLFFWYIIIWLNNSALILLRKRVLKMVHRH